MAEQLPDRRYFVFHPGQADYTRRPAPSEQAPPGARVRVERLASRGYQRTLMTAGGSVIRRLVDRREGTR